MHHLGQWWSRSMVHICVSRVDWVDYFTVLGKYIDAEKNDTVSSHEGYLHPESKKCQVGSGRATGWTWFVKYPMRFGHRARHSNPCIHQGIDFNTSKPILNGHQFADEYHKWISSIQLSQTGSKRIPSLMFTNAKYSHWAPRSKRILIHHLQEHIENIATYNAHNAVHFVHDVELYNSTTCYITQKGHITRLNYRETSTIIAT